MRRWRNWQTHQLEVLAPKRHRGSSPLFRTKFLSSGPAGLTWKAAFNMNFLVYFVVVLHVVVCLFSDRRGSPATRPLCRLGRRLRRTGFPDRFRSPRRGQRAYPAHHLVGGHLHADLDHSDRALPALHRRRPLRAGELQDCTGFRTSQARQVIPLCTSSQLRRQANRSAAFYLLVKSVIHRFRIHTGQI